MNVRTCLGALLSVLAVGCSRAPISRVEWPVMGTVAAVQWHGTGARPDAVEAVKGTFAEIEKLLNAHDPTSELSRLAPLPDDQILSHCDPRVRPCYAAAFRLRDETHGAFNPRWRGTNTLDLGAIAKGFAVDCVRAHHDLLVDLGGNLKALGSSWRVGVAKTSETFDLAAGAACATSGAYYRGAHIHDGRTGAAVKTEICSVTVIHPSSAMLADGLSTILYIFGREKGDEFLRTHYPEARAIWYNTHK